MRVEISCWVILAVAVAAGLTGAILSAALTGKKKKGRMSAAPSFLTGPRFSYEDPIKADWREGTSVLDACGSGNGVFSSSFSRPDAILIRRRTGERVDIKGPLFLIGKDRKRADFCISDNEAVSRIHAGIINRGDAYYLVDRNSTNGTCLNGRKIEAGQESRLEPGDRIRLADDELDFWL